MVSFFISTLIKASYLLRLPSYMSTQQRLPFCDHGWPLKNKISRFSLVEPCLQRDNLCWVDNNYKGSYQRIYALSKTMLPDFRFLRMKIDEAKLHVLTIAMVAYKYTKVALNVCVKSCVESVPNCFSKFSEN